MAEIMEEEASVRNLGRLKSLIRPAEGPANAGFAPGTEGR
ncbi:hypothetical protein FBZ96_10966 [Bradyrhizobium stylosanthis]|uniref:Uncharacterized protein n=1 Tax=Bradyrhizobium stylosanthis TaxID=1803665 RepID=A0A560D8Z6_9BRAD|nr:hypothetical protein FBZ96_10966 [Bradyrhizobium stylosanthis]